MPTCSMTTASASTGQTRHPVVKKGSTVSRNLLLLLKCGGILCHGFPFECVEMPWRVFLMFYVMYKWYDHMSVMNNLIGTNYFVETWGCMMSCITKAQSVICVVTVVRGGIKQTYPDMVTSATIRLWDSLCDGIFSIHTPRFLCLINV